MKNPFNRTACARAAAIALAFASAACSAKPWNKTLPPSTELGSPRGQRIARTIIHLHSPYSYDACDKRGLNSDGVPDANCLAHLREGLCKNHIDFAFLTDHPNKMSEYEFPELLLSALPGADVSSAGKLVGRSLDGCEDGHRPVLTAGYENKLMPIGMTQHAAPDSTTRGTLYQGGDTATIQTLHTQSDAIVFVPHTEQWTAADLTALQPDGIEIYNFHANLDPKISKKYLNFGPYDAALNILPYWIDPSNSETPDLAFISVFRRGSIYSERWGAMIAAGLKTVGIGGSDSHENTLPNIANDDERLDAHRRMLRWMSNHFVVPDLSFESLKTSIRNGRGWLVFEALGTPVGMDFSANTNGSVTGVGDTGPLVAGQTEITVAQPSLHSASPNDGDEGPELILRLIRVLGDGSSESVATARNQPLTFRPAVAGAYRAEISIIPRQLRGFLNYDQEKASEEMPWIITNHIYLQ